MIGWEDESELPDVITSTSLLEETEHFLNHLSPSSSFGFVAGGGLAASGSPNRIRGTLADNWSTLLEWNEAGQNIEIEGCSGFKAVWMRGHFSLGLPLSSSIAIAAGNEELDSYWLVSDRWIAAEQWDAFRRLLHEVFLKLGAVNGSTHHSGAITLPGMKRHAEGMRPELVQLANLPANPRSYSLQELAEAFAVELPVIEQASPVESEPKEIPPARGKVAVAIKALDQRLSKGVKEQDKGGGDTPPVFISDLMHDVGMKDRKNFKKDVLRHLAFVAALEDRGLEYVAGQWRGKAGHLVPKRG